MVAVKKAEFARILNVSKARVSQYVQAGLPVLEDGRINIDAGKAWIRDNVDPIKRSDWATNRAIERRTDGAGFASQAIPAGGSGSLPATALKVLAELPSTVAMGIADAGGTRGLAAHASRIVLEIVHDELVDLAERSGVPAGDAQAWRLEAQRLVRLGSAAVNWAAYFGPDGRSTCAGEIYSVAGE